MIDKALKRDDGTYMCVAENPAGTRRAVAAVRVRGQTTHTVTRLSLFDHSNYVAIN